QSLKASKSNLGLASSLHQTLAHPALQPITGKAGKLPSGGEAGGKANGPAQEQYDNLAYPSTRVAYSQVIATHNAYKSIVAKSKASPKDVIPAGWQQKGPDTLNVNPLGTQDFG